MRVTLLGTGFPRPNPKRRGPSQLVEARGDRFLVDCGSGVACQLVSIGVSPVDVHHVLITHHHSDHTIDLGHLLLTRWIMGQNAPLHVWGPSGTRQYVDDLLRLHDYDIEVRRHHQDQRPGPRVEVHEIAPGVIYESSQLRITAFLVEHFPVEPAFGFRFDGPERSVAISGDTRPCENLIAQCRGVDVLIHECTDVTKLPLNPGGGYPSREVQVARLASYHTLPDQVGKVAARAEAKTLVLSHLTHLSEPAELQRVVARDFGGKLIVGEDLMEV
ncbi:MAG: MBL fold metallo-hydrolase [Candidatus Rokubacteria bacterium]|nr:MBL fold metallo-hydrolase [Candidatus Rokubacteria bacterium]